jgi:hypothetical protein
MDTPATTLAAFAAAAALAAVDAATMHAAQMLTAFRIVVGVAGAAV